VNESLNGKKMIYYCRDGTDFKKLGQSLINIQFWQNNAKVLSKPYGSQH